MILLDEMLPPSIADELSARGFDAVAVAARSDLRGSADAAVLEAATREDRVLVTENIGDFVALSKDWAGHGRAHKGIVLISSKAFPMSRSRAGRITAALLMRCERATWPGPGQYDFLHP